MNSIKQICFENCYSCHSCEQICPKQCISMQETQEGFLYPHINSQICIDCGACLSHCPAHKYPNSEVEDGKFKQEYFAIKLKNKTEILKSSSGGAFSGFAKMILEKGGIVFGAAFTEDFSVAHIKIDTIEELDKLKGSKYVESNTGNTYSEVKELLNSGKIVLYSGSPCQIAGLRKFLGKYYDNLFTLDLICHGTPSRKLFKKYIEWLGEKFKGRIIYYNFRDKKSGGWSCGGKTKTKTKTKTINGYNDPYYSSFLKSYTYKMSCYNCQYANIEKRSGDITIGDFWGVPYFYPHFYSEKGVSEIIINSQKGKELFETSANNFEILPITLEQAKYQNSNLTKPTKMPERRKTIYDQMDKIPLNDYMKSLLPGKKDLFIGWVKSIVPQSLKVWVKSKTFRK